MAPHRGVNHDLSWVLMDKIDADILGVNRQMAADGGKNILAQSFYLF
jgi:hypothetical protein